MSFYKMIGNEFTFQLLNLEVKEEFALWDTTSKKFIKGLPDEVKSMESVDFLRAYPNMRKNTQYIREVVIEGVQYSFGFKKTANDDLNKAIATQQNLGINPLEVVFKLKKSGSGIDTTYAIIAEKKVGIVQMTKPMQDTPITALKPQQPIILPQDRKITFGISKPLMQNVVVLNSEESKIYEASVDYTAEGKLSEQRYIELWNECSKQEYNTLYDIQRIKDIYRELYSKS